MLRLFSLALIAGVLLFPGVAAAQADLAQGRSTSASSSESSAYASNLAVDNNSTTRWSSSWTNAQWWRVDLGSTKTIGKVELNWEAAYASQYKIQTSTTGKANSFIDAATVNITSAGLKTTTFAARSARYVRVLGVIRATQYGISFWDARVFAPAPPPAPDATVTVNRATPSGQSNYKPGYNSVQNEWYYPWGNSLFNEGPDTDPNTAQGRARELMRQSLGYQNTHAIGWGRVSTWPNKADGGPTAWWHLDTELTKLVQNAPGVTPVLDVSMAPYWMMGQRTAGNGMTPATGDFTGNYFVSRVKTDEMDSWEKLTLETVKRYAAPPYNIRKFIVWNELKGFGNPDANQYDSGVYPGTPGKADMGFTYFYNRTYAKVREAFSALGLDPNLAQIGGPYVVGDTWSYPPSGGGGIADIPATGAEANIRSSSTALTGQKSYGYVDARPLKVIEEWLRLKTGAQFIVLRSSNQAKPDWQPVGDVFESTEYFVDQVKWLRGLPESDHPGATTLPVWNIEQYIEIGGPGPFDRPDYDQVKRAAVHATAMLREIKAGYQTTMLWGSNQQFNPGIWSVAYDPANGWDRLSAGTGQPWPMFSILKAIKDNFAPGTNLYPVTVSQPARVEALANANGALLVNKSGSSTTITLDGAAHTLAPHEVRYINEA